MARRKITQKEAIFYQLYNSFKEDPSVFIPVFEFMGEKYCEELGLWGFVSHECSARCSEMKKENPNLIESTTITGRSGAKYYGYRLKSNASAAYIEDKKLLDFYERLKRARQKPQRV